MSTVFLVSSGDDMCKDRLQRLMRLYMVPDYICD